MSEKITLSLAIFFSLIIGFAIGYLQAQDPCSPCIAQEIQPEISIIQLKDLMGDALNVSISGPARIVWGENNIVENDGDFQIPLGQLPTENDQDFLNFPYLGNEKTMKFYPSDSYPARGTEVQYRRFFQTKQEAIDAGFIPMKGMK